MEATAAPGRRARKKEATRTAISHRATELFAERGFDAVTVSEIAEAADVSVKTVFNHFVTKEELFFDRVGVVRQALDAAVTERPTGVTVVEALRRLFADHQVPIPEVPGWSMLEDPASYERVRRWVATEHAAAALRARRLVLAEEFTGHLTQTFTRVLELPPGDDRASVLAAMVVGAMGLRERTYSAAILEGAPPAEVEARVRRVVDEAFGRIAAAFADVDRPAV